MVFLPRATVISCSEVKSVVGLSVQRAMSRTTERATHDGNDDGHDDDDDDDNDDDNENENDKVLCRVKLDCSEMAFEKLLYYLYTGTFTSFLRPRREYLDASAHERVAVSYTHLTLPTKRIV